MSSCAREECSLKSATKRACSAGSPSRLPWHYRVHKEGVHLESCCGVCNLFPGVAIIAITQVVLGCLFLVLLLSHADYYDKLHRSEVMSTMTGAVLSAIIGAGALLIFVAFTENGKLMMVYLFVAMLLWLGMLVLSTVKLSLSCWRVRTMTKVNHADYREANLACTTSLFCWTVCIFYLFGIVIVFSFYHFRYVRRAIYLAEAQCTCH